MSKYCWDIDGVVCTNTYGDYGKAIPDRDTISLINSLYDKGNDIILYTARGDSSGADWWDFTDKQLRGWGVKYHKLYCTKPGADYYIDDRFVDVGFIRNKVK